jgi:hypothetical protein
MGPISKGHGAGPAPEYGADSSAGSSGANGAAYTTTGRQSPTAGADSASAGVGSAGGADQVTVGGVDPLGLDDPSRLIAEAEGATVGIPGDPLAEQAAALDPNGQWSALTPPLVKITAGVVLPAWQITNVEQGEISEALGQCLEQLFPGGVNGKYACWVRLVFCCGAITVSRVQQHGRLPPLFLPTVPPAKPTPPAAAKVDPLTVTSLTE